MDALPHLGQLGELEKVNINLDNCADATAATLEAALLGLCCTAPALQRVNMWKRCLGSTPCWRECGRRSAAAGCVRWSCTTVARSSKGLCGAVSREAPKLPCRGR